MNKNAWYVQVLIFALIGLASVFCYCIMMTCEGKISSLSTIAAADVGLPLSGIALFLLIKKLRGM